jgi:hypothetical protein
VIIKQKKKIYFIFNFFSDVTTVVWNADTNRALIGASVFIGDINYTAPFQMFFARYIILNISAVMTGYTTENKSVYINDTSRTGTAGTQVILFLLTPILVKNLKVLKFRLIVLLDGVTFLLNLKQQIKKFKSKLLQDIIFYLLFENS